MRYRPDIDGLRAIAVILVLIFHGGLLVFPSGFIGVDIFFVISGYLITAIVMSAKAAGNFSLAQFYTRRLLRIQPALLAATLFTLLISLVFYLPDDLTAYLDSAKYSSLFLSNQHFSKVTTGYASPDSAVMLLLHTWSLSIEWQWYLILPLVMITTWRYLGQKSLPRLILLTTPVMLLISLLLSHQHPDKSYYFLLSRIFEFLAGSCVVVLSRSDTKISSWLTTVLGGTALAALIYCARQTSILLGYPDIYAVIVVAATALLIYIGGIGPSPITKILAWRPLVFIGKRSYSLYLWHWPIFAIARYMGFNENVVFKLTCFSLTFIFALLCYRFVEQPLRKLNISLPRAFLLLVVIPIALFTVLLAASKKFEGFAWRFGPELMRIEAVKHASAAESELRQSCLNGDTIGTDAHCFIGDVTAQKSALLIGDSHSNHFWGFFDTLAKNAHISVLAQGTSSCLALPDIYQYDWWHFKNTVYQECYDNVRQYYQLVEKNHYNYVILGQYWEMYIGDNIINRLGDSRSTELSETRIESSFRKALDIIVKSGARPVIIKTVFTRPEGYTACFNRHLIMHAKYDSSQCNSQEWQSDQQDWFPQLFEKLQQDYPSMIIIDPKDVQCHANHCLTEIDGVPIYRDVGHITDFASKTFGQWYLQTYGNPLK